MKVPIFGHGWCQCSAPIIKCDQFGCRCTTCGLPRSSLRAARREKEKEVSQDRLSFPGYQPGDGLGPEKRPTDYVTDLPRHAGRVRRYHTWVVHHQQSVGEHCWQVALVYEQIFGPPRAAIERFIRHHDTAELVVGDPPFPVKMENPDLKEGYDRIEPAALDRMGLPPLPELTPEERVRVKICDLLEMMCHGMTEREMGNCLAAPIVIRTARVAETMAIEKLTEYEAGLVEKFVYECWRRHSAVLKMADVGYKYDYNGRNEL